MTRVRSRFSLPLILSLASFACTPTSATGTPPPASGGSGGHGSSYIGRPQPGQTDPGRMAPPPAADAHHFSPRPHEPHLARGPAAPPVLLTLPGYVDGSQRCFVNTDYRPYNYTAPAPRSGAGYGYGRTPAGTHGGSGAQLGASSGAPAPASPHQRHAAAKSGAPSGAPPAARSESGFSGLIAPPIADAAPPQHSQPSPQPYPRDDERRKEAWFAPDRPPAADGFGVPVYLSNDDTMSLSSAQRVMWAIEHFAPIPRQHVRPHELLNYFSFQTHPVASDHDFSVMANIAALDGQQARLALSVQGRPLSQNGRRNVNLSYVIDRSGSMDAEGRMEYLKQGLLRSLDELKHGDMVHVTLFDSTVCQLAENFVVGRDDLSRLRASIQKITPRGSTNLYDGLRQGYEIADRAYQPGYSNRVVMITDAETNTGVTDESMIALVGQHYDARRIRLSGIGVGSTFNDSLLDQLTERGRGAYVFLGSRAEVDAVFGSRFVSLVETIAGDVHFRLHLPPTLAMATFYGEEASAIKERVQAVHYFAGTSQLFLSDLRLRDGTVPTDDDIMLSIEYEDPESGQARVEEFAFRLRDIVGRAPNLDKASYVDAFARSLQALSDRPLPPTYSEQRYGWIDSQAGAQCRDERQAASFFSAPIQGDPEVRRIEQLWDTFCSRYPVAVRPPLMPRPLPYPVPDRPRNNDYAPPDTWPGATSSR